MSQHVTDSESWIAEHLAGPQKKFARFAERVYDGEALSRKTKELIAAAASSVARCPHCTDSHLEQAQAEGATEAEVAEALAVAWGQGGGTQVFWMKEDFDELLGEDWRAEYLPEADRAFWDFKSSAFESDTLPRATTELIAVALSTMLRCRHCTRSHIEKALEAGASKAAVAEALGVAWVIGSGTQVVWNRDGFEQHLHANGTAT
jgi:alkylhydroperoxidase AhpD family core domain/alkylhydroperoxidase AhpD family core domain